MIKRLFHKQIDARGLAVFRILYGLVLLGEILQLYYFRHLVYDPIPYIEPAEIDVTLAFWVWMLAVGCIVLGVFTRTATIVNYVCSLVFIATTRTYEYHMFYAYMSVNFLLLFIPVSTSWSLDRLFKKLKYSNTRFQYQPPKTVSSLAYSVPVFMAIGLFYADSILYKLNDPVWLHGLGVWLPSSLPMTTHTSLDIIANQEFLVKSFGYFTIVFEVVLIIIMWFKRLRWLCVIIGVGFHIGILIDFPIPFFALGVIALYMLLVPVGFWKNLTRLRYKNPVLFFYYDTECPLCIRTKICIEHFDLLGAVAFRSVQAHAHNEPKLSAIGQNELLQNIYSVSAKGKVYKGLDTYIHVLAAMVYLMQLSLLLRIPGIYHIAKRVYQKVADNRITERCTEETCGYVPPAVPLPDNELRLTKTLTLGHVKYQIVRIFLVLVVLLQLFVSYTSPLTAELRAMITLKGRRPDRFISHISVLAERFAKPLLGITHHGLFVKNHFEGYTHILAVNYVGPDGAETRLPIIDERGMPGPYLYGFNWTKWTFRTNGPNVNMHKLSNGIRSFTAFWAYHNGVNLNNAVFKVYLKKISVPTRWEKDFLKNQLQNNQWTVAGIAIWKDKRYTSEIQNIESM